eukprot:247229-Prorocentrum_minimum.AAC.1
MIPHSPPPLPLPNRSPAVALLDGDCGQPEVTGVPGAVSLAVVRAPLLGPPHLRQLARSAAAGQLAVSEAAARALAMLPEVGLGTRHRTSDLNKQPCRSRNQLSR